ncbi:aminodeoxychorismate synthase component I [Teredinibacter sp. KSP-S5-2]|uniref:aminodeoxychorismate synthase component I n=1 Tax=Teredinibacter sp. KSP-S5-2 TaxID=3034506 RepID=UPI0029347D3F|nr:aminodeoxychorismate synthase component I [Teredinibacter sp. KSP-S5-2]WNO11232.1 aminodeoxychorismate synthase component I [Teredinibacter sp. KSP-S5-2]
MIKQINTIELPYLEDSSQYLLRLEGFTNRVWLDSGYPAHTSGRYDILSANPVQVLHNPSYIDIEQAIATHCQVTESHNSDLPFIGGAIGYFNYDYNHKHFAIFSSKKEKHTSTIGIYTWAVIQDHLKKTSALVFQPNCTQQSQQEIYSALTQGIPKNPRKRFSVSKFESNVDKAEYLKKIQQIKEFILAGDTYQVNYTQEFRAEFSGNPSEAYLALRKSSPSPYSAFLGFDKSQILSLSPEQFIAINNNQAQTQPIKGTISRSENPKTDKENAQKLQESEKNRAENLMIVDLLRNDFSKCCIPHSVKTPQLYQLQSFINVHHLVSTVTGTVKESVSPLNFFLQCFPGGSITGAPKKRAMEIIEELEAHNRGVYCGSVFYLSADSNFDSNIAIRTMQIIDQQIFCSGGGGIVVDSIAEEEYQESIDKISHLMKSLNLV